MKTAKLIKRDQQSQQSDKKEQKTGSQIFAKDVRKSVLKWIRERQEIRQVNPRAQFDALFSNAA